MQEASCRGERTDNKSKKVRGRYINIPASRGANLSRRGNGSRNGNGNAEGLGKLNPLNMSQ